MARFLIVVTFLEGRSLCKGVKESELMGSDALRITTQWGDQLWYLSKSAVSPRQQLYLAMLEVPWTLMTLACRHRKFPWGLSHLFLLINVVVCTFYPCRNPA